MSASTASAGATAVQNQLQGPQRSGGNTLLPQGSESQSTPAGSAPNAPTGAPSKRAGLPRKGAMEHPKTQVITLPPAGREEQLERWGLKADRLGDHLFTADRRGHGPDDTVNTADDVDADERELEERGFLLDGGWTVVDTGRGSTRLEGLSGGARDGGMSSHRGVLHPGEFVDPEALRPQVEAELGFTYEEVRSVYRQGPLNDLQRGLRGRIDARLLALSCAGGNMAELGRALGFPIRPKEGDCQVIKRALERARKEQA